MTFNTRSQRRIVILLATICQFSFFTEDVTFASGASCAYIFGSDYERQRANHLGLTAKSDARELYEKLGKTSKYPDELTGLNYRLKRDQDVVSSLRATDAQRIAKAKSLRPDISKFLKLTDAQLLEQWDGQSELTLPKMSGIQYLSPVSNLKRGDRIRLTRTVKIFEKDLVEFLKTGLLATRHLHVLNYDLSLVTELYALYNLHSVWDLLEYNIGQGGTAVPTTYAKDGWSETRPHAPILYIPRLHVFSLQIEYSVPVEAIVLLREDRQAPKHVEENPSGYGIRFRTEADMESEISFLTAIPPEWISTDLSLLRKTFSNRSYPVSD